jgi:hypothetical protein
MDVCCEFKENILHVIPDAVWRILAYAHVIIDSQNEG